MKPMTQLGLGVCGGALATLLFHTAYLLQPTEPSASVLPVRIEPSTSTGSFPGQVDNQPTGEPLAMAGDLPAGDWAFLDPVGFFDYAERTASIDDLIAGLEVLIAIDPERVFELVSRFNSAGSAEINELYLHAIRGMAGRDPLAAIARLQGIADGPQRDPILAAIAQGYSTVDPDAALQWAASILPPSPDTVDSVLETVASTDLLRAYGLMLQAQGRVADTMNSGYAMARLALASGQPPGSLASNLAAQSGPEADNILSGLMQGWMLQEPDRAVDWMIANEAQLTDELTRAAVYYLAFEDVTRAAELTARVPASAQGQWLSEVANRYGQFDIEAALRWLPQYESRPGYAEILNRTLTGSVMPPGASPLVVARFIATSNADISDEAILRTGYSYARFDPEAATQWALGLNDPERAGVAAAAVADVWAGEDGPAAQRWALEQPRGALRDQIVGAVLTSGVFNESIDKQALVQAFSTPAAAQESIYMFILRDVVNRRDVTPESQAQIEWMMERLTDPELKRQAEERIAAAR